MGRVGTNTRFRFGLENVVKKIFPVHCLGFVIYMITEHHMCVTHSNNNSLTKESSRVGLVSGSDVSKTERQASRTRLDWDRKTRAESVSNPNITLNECWCYYGPTDCRYETYELYIYLIRWCILVWNISYSLSPMLQRKNLITKAFLEINSGFNAII